jgi:sulfur dioxygenase
VIFRQLFDSDSSTYTYLLADTQSWQAVIVDPVRVRARRDLGLLKELGRKLVYILETHVHADHITGASTLKQVTEARTGVSKHCGASRFDQLPDDGDIVKFGDAKSTSPRLAGKTRGQFAEIMKNLNVPLPGKIGEAISANLRGGKTDA